MKSQSPLRLTLGSDPELFVQARDTGNVVSAIPILQRSKHDPIDLGDGIKTYADCVLAEASFPPSHSIDEVMGRLKTVFTRMQEKLGDRYRLLPKSSHVMDPEQLQPSHGMDPNEVGCTPSHDAYTQAIEPPHPFTDGLRTGSFHIHLGNCDWENRSGNPKLLTFNSRQEAVKVLDIIVGCASVIFDKDPSAPARRRLYGRAGNYRACDYGLEHRILGNYALRSPDLTRLVYDLVDHAMEHVKGDTSVDLIRSIPPDMVQRAINECDRELAIKVVEHAKLPLGLLSRVYKDYGDPELNRAWGI